METRALQRHRGNAVILATACIAMALWSASCGGGGSTAVVPVSTAGFSISSTTVTFGNQAVGTTSAAQTATLINVGNETLTISSIQVTGPNAGDYTLTNTCGSSLAPSAQCTLSVTFTPSAAGTRTASVVFTDNAAGSPQTVNLTGTGTSAGVGLSATTLTFGSQSAGHHHCGADCHPDEQWQPRLEHCQHCGDRCQCHRFPRDEHLRQFACGRSQLHD